MEENTLDKRIGQFVQLRDHIEAADKAHKEAMKPKREMLEQLNGIILGLLKDAGLQNAANETHTAYRTTKVSATIADGAAFRKYVLDNDALDLVDWRANKTAVKGFLKEHGGLPPGVNYSVTHVVGVQKK
jgi:hypothetical protein